MRDMPAAEVIGSFGGDPFDVESLDGGEGMSWRARSIVLKPAGPATEVAWVGEFTESLDRGGDVRVARNVRTTAGAYVCEGWAATEWLEGQHRNDRWDETLAAARSFHDAALKAAPEWPAFMRDRSDPWSRATRVAWGEKPMPSLPHTAARLVAGLVELVRDFPGATQVQVIHSDLAGNVLFADDPQLSPAIIDVSPQLRSTQYAEAILVADAVAWNGARSTFAEQFLVSPERVAGVARAIIFRVATAALSPKSTPARVDGEAEGYRKVARLLTQ